MLEKIKTWGFVKFTKPKNKLKKNRFIIIKH